MTDQHGIFLDGVHDGSTVVGIVHHQTQFPRRSVNDKLVLFDLNVRIAVVRDRGRFGCGFAFVVIVVAPTTLANPGGVDRLLTDLVVIEFIRFNTVNDKLAIPIVVVTVIKYSEM